jgi:hypothetical protein
MAQRSTNDIERYRKGMELAFQQIDWCIGYLHGIRKKRIAYALSRNRMYIAKQIAGEEEVELPTQDGAATTE